MSHTRSFKVKMVYKSLLFVLLIGVLSKANNEKTPLHPHIRHYEEVHYNSEQLMHHHYRLRHSIKGPDHLKLAFRAYEQHFDLRLKPDNIYMHKKLEIVVDGEPHPRDHSLMYSYIGHDVNDPTSHVHGHLAFGLFDGTIHTNDEIYHIEPASRYLDTNKTSSHSIIYRHSDVTFRHPKQTAGSSCASASKSTKQYLEIIQHSHQRDALSLGKHLQKRQSGERNSAKIGCWINVVGDKYFYDAVTTTSDNQHLRIAQATALIKNAVATASNIYKKTDFDKEGQNQPDGINFALQKISINTTHSHNKLSNQFLGVETVLNYFSEADWSDFCLSFLFTNREFESGVLGLAFVAETGKSGGICDDAAYHGGIQKTLNTGVVTSVNYGQRVPNAVMALTFAHETGHNFGSKHDSDSDPTCSPSNNKYIMTAYANDGSKTNNYKFSPCSISSMYTIIGTVGQDSETGCFRLATDNCGNSLLDEGEDCDCGVDYDGNGRCTNDPCCNAMNCTVAKGAECSPQSGSCCATNCTIIREWSNFHCSQETECALSQTCNGTSVHCPKAEPKTTTNSSLSCNNGSNYCVDGECTGSVCVILQLPDCECTNEELLCHVCCQLPNGTCVSTINLAQRNESARNTLPKNKGQLLAVGYACKNYTGFCDFLHKCRPVNEEGALTRLTNLISGSTTIQTTVSWLRRYWWASIIMAVTILVILFIIVLVCHCLLPRPEHMKKRRERRRTIRNRRHHATQLNEHQMRETGSQMQNFWIDTI